jgi:hypothetical protein
MKRLLSVLMFVFAATGVCAAQNVIYFPQIADGVQGTNIFWGTAIAVTNTAAVGAAPASATITLTQSNGAPMNVRLYNLEGQLLGTGSGSFQIAGGQTKFILSQTIIGETPLPLAVGYATLTSNQSLSGGAVFVESAADRDIGEATTFSATPLTRQTIFVVNEDGSDTALAVANPGNSAANLSFQLLDINGTIVATAARTLQPRNHTALFVRQLFPNAPQQVFGSLRITSDVGVVTLGLLFESSGLFTTLPVFPLQ